MKTNLSILVAVAMASSLSSVACTSEVGTDEDIAQSESEIRLMNGDRLSGVSLNGINVGGSTLNGVNYAGITIGGVAVSNVYLDGTILHGTLPGGQALSGADFIGAELQGSMSDGSSLTIRIDNITTTADADILHYSFSYQQPGGGGSWVGICGVEGSGAAVKGFPLAGRWDTSAGTATGGSFIDDAGRFTIACRGAALAKCAEMTGYKPWETKEECTSWGECQSVSLRDVHQACVRMVRADYCGDGTSLTVVGTEIDAWDGLGIKDEDATATWDLEAEWSANGAQCVSHVRWVTTNDMNVERYILDYCPEKWAGAGGSIECGREESTFFVDNGFSTASDERVFLRNKSEVHQ